MFMNKQSNITQKLTPTENNQQQRILDHQQQVKLHKRKIKLLKQAYVAQQQQTQILQSQILIKKQKAKKYQVQNKKWQQKNQALLIQIRHLRDALILQKSQKKIFEDKLKQTEQVSKNNNNSSMFSMGNMFGLKSFFKAD